jgi:hypothetical protein
MVEDVKPGACGVYGKAENVGAADSYGIPENEWMVED